jgi:hypothetical protein
MMRLSILLLVLSGAVMAQDVEPVPDPVQPPPSVKIIRNGSAFSDGASHARSGLALDLSRFNIREFGDRVGGPDDRMNFGPAPRGRWVRLGTFPLWEQFR